MSDAGASVGVTNVVLKFDDAARYVPETIGLLRELHRRGRRQTSARHW